ncbi:MAG: hypothetical protein KC503_07040 [Myxococcales bacterium]|nr:hypothetical protein [Myxococcales bacterium]
MKRVTKLLAITFVCSLALAGCKKKKGDGAGTGSAAAGTAAAGTAAAGTGGSASKPAGTAEGTAAAGTGSAAGTAAGGGGDVPEAVAGVAECKSYFKMYSCYLGKLPAAASGPAKKAWKTTVDAWAKMPKAGLATACKAAMDAWKKSAAASPQMKKWVDDCSK